MNTIRQKLCSCSQKLIEDHYQVLDIWIHYNAKEDFGELFVDVFDAELSAYLTDEDMHSIMITGRNIVHALQTFMSFRNPTLSELLSFTYNMIQEQVDDFPNWCERVWLQMVAQSSRVS